MRRKMTRREDYLKLIYTLSRKGEVHGADLADELDVKRPTVCVYLKRLWISATLLWTNTTACI